MRRLLIVLAMLSLGSLPLSAQSDGVVRERRYAVHIDIRQAYISGVCLMRSEGDTTVASIINEFGVSALTYRYDERRGRVKILTLLKPMDNALVRCMLRHNLKRLTPQLLKQPSEKNFEYSDTKHKIRYRFTPIVE